MDLNDANALVQQVNPQQVGERFAAASRSDPSGVVDLADLAELAVDATPVAVEAAFGLFEVIGEILAGILS